MFQGVTTDKMAERGIDLPIEMFKQHGNEIEAGSGGKVEAT